MTTQTATTNQAGGNDILVSNLINASTFFISQHIEPWEMLTGCETRNRYDIFNEAGQHFLSAVESSSCLIRICLTGARPMDIFITDPTESNTFIKLERPCFCVCYDDEVKVEYPHGSLLGSVSVNKCCKCCTNLVFHMRDATGNDIMRVETPLLCQVDCDKLCCNDIFFDILDNSGNKIGIVTKPFPGFCKDFLTDADRFAVTFPKKLPMDHKVMLLSACLMIDIGMFESQQQNPALEMAG